MTSAHGLIRTATRRAGQADYDTIALLANFNGARMLRAFLISSMFLTAAGNASAQTPSCCSRFTPESLVAIRATDNPSPPGRPHIQQLPQARLALAIGAAAKKSFIEQGVEGYKEILIQCQKERSFVLTTPLLRSESQQQHCYRF